MRICEQELFGMRRNPPSERRCWIQKLAHRWGPVLCRKQLAKSVLEELRLAMVLGRSRRAGRDFKCHASSLLLLGIESGHQIDRFTHGERGNAVMTENRVGTSSGRFPHGYLAHGRRPQGSGGGGRGRRRGRQRRGGGRR